LYHLALDPSETNDVAKDYPEKVAELMKHAEAARAELGDRLTKSEGSERRPSGRLTDEEHAALEKIHWPNGRPEKKKK